MTCVVHNDTQSLWSRTQTLSSLFTCDFISTKMDMDFTTPFTSSQSYVDLLQSQPDLSTPDSLSQQTHSPLNQTPSTDTREPRQRWKVLEEKVLVSAWLNTSKDAIVGNEQKSGTFWQRVADYYAASPNVAGLPHREANTCKQKWRKLSESVSKFAGCYEYASRNKRSGHSEDDVMEMAYQLYTSDHKVKFTLEHAWRMLKNDQKWCTFISEKNKPITNKQKTVECTGQSSTNTAGSMEEETEERPLGVKASKAKGKKRVRGQNDADESSLKVLQEMWVIKKEDLAAKERLSKQKILDSLIAKPEPLSEIELTLKNKLIIEMCNLLG